MKNLLYLVLVMGILCLAGCSEDEPQSVAFSVRNINAGNEGIRVGITITANCRWIIKNEGNRTRTEIQEGEGTMETVLVVFSNPDYEPRKYVVSVTSEDGTSSDCITIHQEELYGLEMTDVEVIPAEGGPFRMPISTNVSVTDIDAPEWITFTSSRSLTDYTYSFSAEPNKTGAPRSGFIAMTGEHNISDRIEVRQDSYAPTDVVLQKDLIAVQSMHALIPFKAIPEYADISKISIKTSDGCTASISENELSVSMENFGLYTYTFLSGKEQLAEGKILCLPTNLIDKSCADLFYIEQKARLELNFDCDKFAYNSSDPNVASISSEGEMEMKSEGVSVVSVSVPGSDITESHLVTVKKALFSAFVSFYESSFFGDLEITAVIHGKNITEYTFSTADYGRAVVVPQHIKQGEFPQGKDCLTYQTYIANFNANLNAEELAERLKDLKIEFAGTVNGEKINLSTCVSFEKEVWMDCQ